MHAQTAISEYGLLNPVEQSVDCCRFEVHGRNRHPLAVVYVDDLCVTVVGSNGMLFRVLYDDNRLMERYRYAMAICADIAVGTLGVAMNDAEWWAFAHEFEFGHQDSPWDLNEFDFF